MFKVKVYQRDNHPINWTFVTFQEVLSLGESNPNIIFVVESDHSIEKKFMQGKVIQTFIFYDRPILDENNELIEQFSPDYDENILFDIVVLERKLEELRAHLGDN